MPGESKLFIFMNTRYPNNRTYSFLRRCRSNSERGMTLDCLNLLILGFPLHCPSLRRGRGTAIVPSMEAILLMFSFRMRSPLSRLTTLGRKGKEITNSKVFRSRWRCLLMRMPLIFRRLSKIAVLLLVNRRSSKKEGLSSALMSNPGRK